MPNINKHLHKELNKYLRKKNIGKNSIFSNISLKHPMLLYDECSLSVFISVGLMPCVLNSLANI